MRALKHHYSIVIPTYNRAHRIIQLLTQLSSLKYDPDKYEIIVVDNNSSDNTQKVVKNFIKSNPKTQLRYVKELRQGRTFAANKGTQKARFSHVIFIDDDIVVQPNLIDIFNTLYTRFPKAAIIGGKIVAQFADSSNFIFKLLSRERYFWIFGEINHGNRLKKISYPDSLFTGIFAINSKLISDQPFNRLLGKSWGQFYLYGEDYELCLRTNLEKKLIIYSPELVCFNLVENQRLSLFYILKRFFCAGIELFVIDYQLSQKYPGHILVNKFNFQLLFSIKSKVKYSQAFLSYFIDLVTETCFMIGYHLVGPWYLKRGSL